MMTDERAEVQWARLHGLPGRLGWPVARRLAWMRWMVRSDRWGVGMSRRGINFPNTPWRPYSAMEVAALWELQPETLLVLVYETAYPFESQHCEVVRRYLADFPKTRVIMRMMAEAIPTYVPEQWARECCRRLNWWAIPGAHVIPDNERNLLLEHGARDSTALHEDWDAHVDWLRRFATTFRALSDAPLHLSALSPTGAYREGLERYAAAGVHRLFDYADAHCYPGSEDDWRFVAEVFGLPVSITEYNRIDPAALGAAVDERVADRCWFILSGTDDWREFFLIGSGYEESFKRQVPPRRSEDQMGLQVAELGGVQVYDVRDRYPYFGNRRYEVRPLSAITRVIQHHSASSRPVPTTVEDALAYLDVIHNWHTGQIAGGYDWPAIGYHFGIDGAGRIYWVNGLELISYHAREANVDGIGVVWLGDFTSTPPNDTMIAAAVRLKLGLDRHVGKPLAFFGHREVMTDGTACPGEHWAVTKARMLRMMSEPATVPARMDMDRAIDALNGMWHYLNVIEGAGDLDTVRTNVPEVRLRIVRLKEAIGLQ